jgi:hypothetical protein
MIAYKDWKSKEKIIEIYENSHRDKEAWKTIRPNDIKEGAVIYQYNGWYGEILGNEKGIRRLANIHGDFTEAGSIFVWDIATCIQDGEMYTIEMPPKYKKQYEQYLEMYG